MSKLILIPLLILLSACDGSINTNISSSRFDYNSVCLEGVVYYEGYRRLSVAFNRDSTVKVCGDE